MAYRTADSSCARVCVCEQPHAAYSTSMWSVRHLWLLWYLFIGDKVTSVLSNLHKIHEMASLQFTHTHTHRSGCGRATFSSTHITHTASTSICFNLQLICRPNNDSLNAVLLLQCSHILHARHYQEREHRERMIRFVIRWFLSLVLVLHILTRAFASERAIIYPHWFVGIMRNSRSGLSLWNVRQSVQWMCSARETQTKTEKPFEEKQQQQQQKCLILWSLPWICNSKIAIGWWREVSKERCEQTNDWDAST